MEVANGAGCFEVKVWANTAKLTDVIVARCTTEYVTLMITDNSKWILTSWTHGLKIGV